MIKLVETKQGIVAVLKNDTHLSRWVEEQKNLITEQAVPLFILPHINPGDVVVDAGACIGDHTYAYAEKVGPSGAVIAFEPCDLSWACAVVNLRDFPWVHLVKAALGDVQEYKVLYIDPNVGASNLNVLKHFGDNYWRMDRTRVPIHRLDDYGLQRLNFLKIDVEGYELKLLQGARETLNRCRPKIICEINQRTLNAADTAPEKVIDFMQSIGYELTFPEPNQRKDVEHYDAFFMPK